MAIGNIIQTIGNNIQAQNYINFEHGTHQNITQLFNDTMQNAITAAQIIRRADQILGRIEQSGFAIRFIIRNPADISRLLLAAGIGHVEDALN